MLTTLWHDNVVLAPQAREEASSVMQSTRFLAESRASDAVSVRFAGTSQLSRVSVPRQNEGKCPTISNGLTLAIDNRRQICEHK